MIGMGKDVLIVSLQKGMGMLRNPHTKQELTTNVDEDHSGFTRGKRRNLPNSFDDIHNQKQIRQYKLMSKWLKSQVGKSFDKVYTAFLAKFKGHEARDFWKSETTKDYGWHYAKCEKTGNFIKEKGNVKW